MTYLVIVGLVLYFFVRLVMKLAGANGSRPKSVGPQDGTRNNNPSTNQDTSVYGQSLAQTSAKGNSNRTASRDESIIEVTPEPVRISYGSYYSSLENGSVHTPAYDPDEYKLSKKYKEKLTLTKQEVGWLNKFWNDANVFNSIDGCEVEIVKLYLATVKRINSLLKKEGMTLSQEIDAIAQKSLDSQKPQTSYWTDYDTRMHKESVTKEVYHVIYKKSESVVRDRWNHKRKIQAEFYPYSPEIKALFDERLAIVIDDSLAKSSSQIGEPDDLTEIALNETGTGRWKTQFELITKDQGTVDQTQVIARLYRLGEMNVKNPQVEHVYYEASKFLANQDKLESLKFYLYYIWHDLNSKQVDGKQLNRTIQKKLFAKQQELELFRSIVDELVKSKNLQKALSDVSGIYAPRRKSIKIDVNAVQLAEKQHAGTVEILSEYLRDEHEPENIVDVDSSRGEEMTVLIGSADLSVQTDTYYRGKIDFSPVQQQCLKVFEEMDFTLSFESVESFAKQNGHFKNQLIDGINDRCMDLLDDVLIEETEGGFEVNVNYYKQIFAA